MPNFEVLESFAEFFLKQKNYLRMLLNTLRTNSANRFQVWELSGYAEFNNFGFCSSVINGTWHLSNDTSFIQFTVIKNSPRVLRPLSQPRCEEAFLKVENFPCAWNKSTQDRQGLGYFKNVFAVYWDDNELIPHPENIVL